MSLCPCWLNRIEFNKSETFKIGRLSSFCLRRIRGEIQKNEKED